MAPQRVASFSAGGVGYSSLFLYLGCSLPWSLWWFWAALGGPHQQSVSDLCSGWEHRWDKVSSLWEFMLPASLSTANTDIGHLAGAEVSDHPLLPAHPLSCVHCVQPSAYRTELNPPWSCWINVLVSFFLSIPSAGMLLRKPFRHNKCWDSRLVPPSPCLTVFKIAFWHFDNRAIKLGLVVHAYNPSTLGG